MHFIFLEKIYFFLGIKGMFGNVHQNQTLQGSRLRKSPHRTLWGRTMGARDGSKMFANDRMVLGVAWGQGSRDYMQDSYGVNLTVSTKDGPMDFFGYGCVHTTPYAYGYWMFRRVPARSVA